jgi:hypothetical protein
MTGSGLESPREKRGIGGGESHVGQDDGGRERAVEYEANPDEPRRIEPLSPAGIGATALSPVQKELLLEIVDAYASVMSPDIAALRMAKIQQGGTDNITFAWAGGTLRGEVSYFRVQGPSFLIEFDHTARDPNHVHSAWRDFDGDFGRDLIGEHMDQQGH